MLLTNSNTRNYKIQVKRGTWKPTLLDKGTMRYEGPLYATFTCMKNPVYGHLKRIDKHTYKVLKTGEIRRYNAMSKSAKMQVRRASLRRTFDELRALIRTNFVNEGEYGASTQLFVTLTYAENMEDTKRLYKDWLAFWKKLERRYPEHGLEYIVVMEPQGRGAWHIHAMIKATKKPVFYMDKRKLTPLWKHGRTDAKRLKSNDVGAYYTAYFTNLIQATANVSDDDILETGEEIFESEQKKVAEQKTKNEKMSKAVLKGSRLDMYPPYFKFYRCSRGITRPKVEKGTYLYDVSETDGYKEVYSRVYDVDKLSPDEQSFMNSIYRGTFKKGGLEDG